MSAISKRVRMAIAARPLRNAARFEGVRRGVATSGTTGPEVKNYDFAVTNTAVVTGTPYVASLGVNITEGVTGTQRIGMKILLKSVDLQMNIQPMVNGAISNATAVSGLPPSFMDVFIIWDKQPGGAVAAASTIFTTSATPLTYTNIAQLERFVVLRRKRFVIDGSTSNANVLTEHVPLELSVRYTDAADEPQTNDILIVDFDEVVDGEAGQAAWHSTCDDGCAGPPLVGHFVAAELHDN